MITAAPAVADAPAPAASAPSTGAAPEGFDAILLLQGLAATTETLDAACFEAADTSDALAADDGDEDSDDLENSLAFLADLIAATAIQPAHQGSADDFAAGAGEGGTDEASATLLAAANDADAGFALIADAGKTDSLLAAVTPDTADPRQTADAAQNMARAAEMLAQTQRAGQAEAIRPAVATHARDPRWADDFSARVSLVIRAGESTASLQLTPVDLGPVEIKVVVKDSQATIHFGAAQAETRSLIEASLPRLRELLASQGFNLMDASVSSGFTRQQQQAFASPTRGGASNEAETSTSEARITRQLGLLDLYA